MSDGGPARNRFAIAMRARRERASFSFHLHNSFSSLPHSGRQPAREHFWSSPQDMVRLARDSVEGWQHIDLSSLCSASPVASDRPAGHHHVENVDECEYEGAAPPEMLRRR